MTNLRKYKTKSFESYALNLIYQELPIQEENNLNIYTYNHKKTCRIDTYSNFLFKLINIEIDDAFLLNQIHFKINNLRNNDLFYIRHISLRSTC